MSGSSPVHDDTDDLRGLPPKELQEIKAQSDRWVMFPPDKLFERICFGNAGTPALGTDGAPESLGTDDDYITDFDRMEREGIRPFVHCLSLLFDNERANQISGFTAMREFLLKHHLVITSKSSDEKKANITHVSLNGGKFSIRPPKLLQRFYELYALMLGMGFDLFFVERPDESCAMRFALDLDFKHVLRLKARALEAIMIVVQRVVRAWFPDRPDEDLTVVVCGAPYQIVDAKKKTTEAKKKGSAPSLSDETTLDDTDVVKATQLRLQQKLLAKRAKIARRTAQDAATAATDDSAAAAAVSISHDTNAPSKEEDAETPKLIKVGVHTLWRKLFMSARQALILRHNIFLALEYEFGRREEPANSWDDVVDNSIYKHGGLRMVGSFKLVPCPDCSKSKKDKDVWCPTCEGHGRVNDNRKYMPMFCLKADGTRDRELEHHYTHDAKGLYDLVMDTRIRTTIPLSEVSDKKIGMRRPPTFGDIPKALEIENWSKALSNSRGKRPRDSASSSDDGSPVEPSLSQIPRRVLEMADDDDGQDDDGRTRWKQMAAVSSSEISYEAFENVIRSFSPEYKYVSVSDVRTDKRRSLYVVRIRGKGSRFCHNVQREHRSYTSYFVIQMEGCRQHCWHRDDNSSETVSHIPCSRFRTRFMPLPTAVQKILFPQSVKKAPLRDTVEGHLPLASSVCVPTIYPTPGEDAEDAMKLRQHLVKRAFREAQKPSPRLNKQLGFIKTISEMDQALGNQPLEDLIRANESTVRKPMPCDGSGIGSRGFAKSQALGITNLQRPKEHDPDARRVREAMRKKRIREFVQTANAGDDQVYADNRAKSLLVALAKNVTSLDSSQFASWKRSGFTLSKLVGAPSPTGVPLSSSPPPQQH